MQIVSISDTRVLASKITEARGDGSLSLNPFPGLRSFETCESHLFFGRENQALELVTRLHEQHFVAVVGLSGSGKSSLVRAGLLPLLYGGFLPGAGSLWRIAVMRPGHSPMQNLTMALVEAGFPENNEDDVSVRTRLLREKLAGGSFAIANLCSQSSHPANVEDKPEAQGQSRAQDEKSAAEERLLLIVDQFEELFRFADLRENADETTAFLRLITESAKLKENVFVIITMRSEYLGECAAHRELAELINCGMYLVPRLSRTELERTILGPVRIAQATIKPALVTGLLNELSNNQDQLPVLQHALMRTFTHWLDQGDKDCPIDQSNYDATGGMEKALAKHAGEVLAELGEERAKVAEKVFKCITTTKYGQPVRRPQSIKKICAITGCDNDAVITVINAFRALGRWFLVPSAGQDVSDDTVIDIAHESLIRIWDSLRNWARDEADSARVFQRLIQTSQMYKSKSLQQPELGFYEKWWKLNSPNKSWAEQYIAQNGSADEAALTYEEVESFLAKSKADESRKRLMQRSILSVLVLAIVMLISFWVFQSWSRNEKNIKQLQVDLADEYLKQGKYERAEELYVAALETERKVLGPNHALVALTMRKLAKVYEDLGRYAESLDLLLEVRKIQATALKSDDPEVATTMRDMAQVYARLGENEEAEGLLKESLAIQQKAFGTDDIHVAATMRSLGNVYVIQRNYKDAERLLKGALEIQTRKRDRFDPDVARTMEALANLYEVQGKIEASMEQLRKAQEILSATRGPDDPEYARILHRLADAYAWQQRFEDAEFLYKKTLDIQKRALGPSHPDVAATMVDLAQLYVLQTEYERAKSLLVDSLRIQERALGPDHPESARTLRELGGVYAAEGDLAKAVDQYSKAKRILEKIPGRDNTDLASVEKDLANAWYLDGQYVEAQSLLEEALKIYQTAARPNPADVAGTMRDLAKVLRRRNRRAEASNLETKAKEILAKQDISKGHAGRP